MSPFDLDQSRSPELVAGDPVADYDIGLAIERQVRLG
jgi:hypothetical protein